MSVLSSAILNLVLHCYQQCSSPSLYKEQREKFKGTPMIFCSSEYMGRSKSVMMAQRFKTITAVHLFLLRKNQVLLLRRFQTGYEDGNYSVIAGHIEGNEEVKSAMIREAKEEVAIHIQPENLKVVGVMHRKASDERIDFFLATHHWDRQIVNAEPHKCDDLSWFDLDALPENIVPYIRKALENYQKDIWFDSVGWDESH